MQTSSESSRHPVVCFGELLFRLDTPGYQRFQQASQWEGSFTGGEANVAVALAQWDVPASIVSTVPAHEIGTACLNHFRRYGVATDAVTRSGDRLGILFVETGASQRSSKVIYDRQHTSFREMAGESYDWNAILAKASWLHFTGTAPAFGAGPRTALRQALAAARHHGVRVSFDVSFRSTLWTVDEAVPVFREIMPFVDVFIGSEQDARTFFGIDATGHESMSRLAEAYDLEVVAYTTRTISPTGINTYQAQVLHEGEEAKSRRYEIDVIDRIGTGDAFCAGVIRGLLQQQPVAEWVEFATAAAVLKHSIPGDLALLSVAEIERLAIDGGTGRVQR